jgi:hypothetical protein
MAIAILEKSFQLFTGKKQNQQLDHNVFGAEIGVITSLFGCWHERVSRPFTEGKSAYRACLNCGARKPFDKETLETKDKFYYPPIIRNVDNI